MSANREPLPVPRGGWASVIVQAVLAAVLWAIAAFAVTALVLPTIDLECETTATGATLCPRPQDRDPVLTHLFDVLWPPVEQLRGVVVFLISMMLGFVSAKLLDVREPWKGTGGAPPHTTFLTWFAGVGIGLLVAGPGFTHPLIAIGISGIGLLLCLAAGFGLRYFARALRERHAAHLRVAELRERGRRTRAPVAEFTWDNSWGGDERVFIVTARLLDDRDRRIVTNELRVPVKDAPVVGGTVVVYSDDQRDHPTGIDILMEPDPDSIRDPKAESRYPDNL